MNEAAKRVIHDDYREILSRDAGMRILGGIFRLGGLQSTGQQTEYQQGRRDIALMVANTVFEVNPYGVADCITAYEDFVKEYADDERRTDDWDYDY